MKEIQAILHAIVTDLEKSAAGLQALAVDI